MFSILIVVLFLLQVRGDLVLKPSVTSLTRDQYKSFVASCSGQSNTRVIGWRSPQHGDVPQNEHDRVTIERQENEIRLRVRNLTADDQGAWECIGVDAAGQQTRKSFQLRIKIPITFYGDSIQYAALGESVIIKCQVQANPAAEVSWFKGAEKTRIEGPHYTRVKEGLRIDRVEMSDNETFCCRADVLETGETRDFPITVIISKSVTQPRITCANPCAIEKKTATLVCEATGLPPPKYSWYYGSAAELRPVKDSPVGASEVPKFVVRGNQLTINYVDETDNGKYSCQAYNEFDRKGQRAEYNLNVIVPPRLLTIEPIDINLDEQHHQRISFVCRIDRGSSESLSLEWQYLNNTAIQATNGIHIDRTRLETDKLIELRFEPVRREHFGNYSCVAKNLADSSYSLASLYIRFQPVFVGPNIQTVSTIPNYRVVMRCQFESHPPPQIQWIKMSRTVQDPEGRVLDVDIDNGVNDIATKQLGPTLFESVLSYTPSERDFGLSFECRAINPRVGRHSFTLQRAEPPKKVRVMEIKPFTNEVEILVQPPETGGLPLMEYIVKYSLADKTDDQQETLTIPAQTLSDDQQEQTQVLKIDKIKPSTSYRFSIVAKSRAGLGQLTGPIPFRTLDRQIPDFKIVKTDENKNETCSNDRTCLIKWIIESDGGAPIIRTEVLYAKAKSDNSLEPEGSFSTPISIDSSVSEYELTELKPSTNYIVIVKLYNEAGAAEQKLRITTLNQRDRKAGTIKPLIKDYRKNQPSKWVILGIIFGIILFAVAFVGVCVALRVYRLGGKHKTTDSDHQSTPMMNGNNGENTSDQHEYTNGHSSKKVFRKKKSKGTTNEKKR
ncbi:unnamed protein product [Rotaria sp. Silwood2]|nr:unnamed protein product [Rotaria sp. Silwood2]CAF2486201.1 unnamed protein product [Rotaria sp. Silwood2]CAF2717677.1 unnamed protein product [Rotaria sp. Silwood2]CAF2869751.1 unnamed protein product [Rotaria sp. Silwood2]